MADEIGSGNSNGWMQAAMGALITGASAITKGGPKRQLKYNKKMAAYQNKLNRANAEWVLEQNRALSEEQRAYDSPASQMERYRAANLNPNLVYSQGSTGNMNSPVVMGSVPGVNVGQVDASYPDIGSDFLNSQMALSQQDLVQQKTGESKARTEILGVQKAIAQTNPMLDPNVANSVANSLMQVADAKAQTASWELQSQGSKTNGQQKLDADLQALFNKNFLSGATLDNTEADLKIKNQILQSKEFANELDKIRVDWMKNGDINPEQIRQGIMMILSKMMGK